MTEEQFLEEYDSSLYEKPSVTADALVFTMNQRQNLEVLLVKRNSYPYEGKWSLPGSFIGMDEIPEETITRALKQKTGLAEIYSEQLYTFAAVDRDPRMRIISISYMALVPRNNLQLEKSGTVTTFEICTTTEQILLKNEELDIQLSLNELAFDHGYQLQVAIERLQGKIDYTDIAFELLRNKRQFTIFELKKIHEAILNEPLDTGNFRRSFKKKYIDTGKVVETGIESTEYSNKPSATYALCE